MFCVAGPSFISLWSQKWVESEAEGCGPRQNHHHSRLVDAHDVLVGYTWRTPKLRPQQKSDKSDGWPRGYLCFWPIATFQVLGVFFMEFPRRQRWKALRRRAPTSPAPAGDKAWICQNEASKNAQSITNPYEDLLSKGQKWLKHHPKSKPRTHDFVFCHFHPSIHKKRSEHPSAIRLDVPVPKVLESFFRGI